MTEWTALALIFVVTTFAALALMALLRRSEDDPVTEEPARRMFGPLTPGVAGMIPAPRSTRQDIQQELWLAGYYQPAALDNFLATRSLLVVLPLVAGLVFALFADSLQLIFICVGLGVACAVLGYSVPRLMLRSEGKDRAEKIRRGIPIFMDTLGLCLSTGTSLPSSFRRSGETIRRGYPDLSQEVRVVDHQARLRSMEHALNQWRRRIPLPEVGSLVFLLSQSDRLGTDVTKGLWELSTSYRVTTRQNAEAAANRTSFYLLFPTVLCLVMAAGIVLVGPGLLKMGDEASKVQQAVNEAANRKNAGDDVFNKPTPGKNPPVGSTPRQPPPPTRVER